ncbi:protein FAM136A-like [Thrips palmi]|uniref:Protein FAM136A-like n=1 Tax=Thrips palmi TaxID=161013 RepID=A0A6P8ZP08_THRPL|nr:protein FAM136A-like [Thrips palmi]
MDLINQQQDRVIKALEQTFEQLKSGKELRKLKAQEFRCQASCYENERIPDDQLENCGNNCSLPVARFINFVNREYSGVVERTNRCGLQCLDQEKDRMGSKFNESQDINFSREFQSCVTRCIDDCLNVHMPKTNKEVRRELAAVKIPE